MLVFVLRALRRFILGGSVVNLRQHQGMDRPGVRQVPEGSGEQGKMEKTGCKIICIAPTTLAVKGSMVMMMMWDINDGTWKSLW